MTATRRRFLAGAAALAMGPLAPRQPKAEPEQVTVYPGLWLRPSKSQPVSATLAMSPRFARQQYPDGSEESDGALIERIRCELA